MKKYKRRYADRVVYYMFLCPPFELLYWVKREEMYYLYYDFPAAYRKAVSAVLAAYRIIIERAAEAGVRMIFYGAPGGTEFTSPAIWEEAIVPASAALEESAAANGIRTLFHCCGRVSKIIEAGFLDRIGPTIYETMAAPPAGDVADLKKARSMLGKKIISHGNLDLQFLRDSDAETVRKAARAVLESTRGFPHALGAGDSCILPGTPAENIRAALSAAEEA